MKSGWEQLAVARFKCGCPKSPENTQLNSNGYERCATHHRIRCTAYRRSIGIPARQ